MVMVSPVHRSVPYRARLLVTCVAGGAAAAACTAQTAQTASVDVAGTWTAVEVAGRVPDAHDAPRLRFQVGRGIQGATGCADFTAPLFVDDARIAVGPLRIDSGDCGADARDVHVAFVAALQSAGRISGGQESGRLVLSGPAGEIVLAQPAP